MKHETDETVEQPGCVGHDHPSTLRQVPDIQALERAARLFRAMGDAPRLRILSALIPGECCVSQLIEHLGGEKYSTMSQRLRVLHSEGLVNRRREKTHVYYSLADAHVTGLVANAIEHARELNR
jgi:DNA-binding transcriptional ArsR family regulator